jgi:hypothetical protein
VELLLLETETCKKNKQVMKGHNKKWEGTIKEKRGAEMPKIYYKKFSWMIGPHKIMF